jgi:hypothetical protein
MEDRDAATGLFDLWGGHKIGEFTLPRPGALIERVDEAR